MRFCAHNVIFTARCYATKTNDIPRCSRCASVRIKVVMTSQAEFVAQNLGSDLKNEGRLGKRAQSYMTAYFVQLAELRESKNL